MRNFVFTSTSVTEGHPDKLCDQISDAIVDAFLCEDRASRIVAECAIATGAVFLITHQASDAIVDLSNIVRDILARSGYSKGRDFSAEKCAVMSNISTLQEVVPSIAGALEGDALDALKADTNATVFGYACAQTDQFLPLPIALAHGLTRELDQCRRSRLLPDLHPDGQAQVTVEFQARRPAAVRGISISTALLEDSKIDPGQLESDLMNHVVDPAVAAFGLEPVDRSLICVNPPGAVFIGGPMRHAGLTGRKNGVDCYGGFSRNSSSALSGKDPWRIDRTGAYAARHAARTVVAAGLAYECEVQISYGIGRAQPISVELDTYGSGVRPDSDIADAVRSLFDFRPAAVIRNFALLDQPRNADGEFYHRLAVYGHFGRSDVNAPWEQSNMVEMIREDLKTDR